MTKSLKDLFKESTEEISEKKSVFDIKDRVIESHELEDKEYEAQDTETPRFMRKDGVNWDITLEGAYLKSVEGVPIENLSPEDIEYTYNAFNEDMPDKVRDLVAKKRESSGAVDVIKGDKENDVFIGDLKEDPFSDNTEEGNILADNSNPFTDPTEEESDADGTASNDEEDFVVFRPNTCNECFDKKEDQIFSDVFGEDADDDSPFYDPLGSTVEEEPILSDRNQELFDKIVESNEPEADTEDVNKIDKVLPEVTQRTVIISLMIAACVITILLIIIVKLLAGSGGLLGSLVVAFVIGFLANYIRIEIEKRKSGGGE